MGCLRRDLMVAMLYDLRHGGSSPESLAKARCALDIMIFGLSRTAPHHDAASRPIHRTNHINHITYQPFLPSTTPEKKSNAANWIAADGAARKSDGASPRYNRGTPSARTSCKAQST